jgi:hypothetical protein
VIYFDSSALVKRYVEETGSDRVTSILANAGIIATSKLTYPEILSAFARRHKVGEIPTKWYTRVIERFETEWEYFLIIEFQNELLPFIRKTIKEHQLKAADSVHLSSALWLRNAVKEDVIFVASDVNLLNAAQSERLQIIDPQKGES